MGRCLFGIVVGAALVATPSVTRASASYPALIQQQLSATCAPACTVCHNSLNGGTGTVTAPFGRTMTGLGLIAESPAALQRALDQDKAQRLDSDGDGDTDIDALVACKDPNQPNAGDGGNAPTPASTFTDPTPEYGCAIGRAPAGERAEGAWAAIAACAAFALRKRSCRTRQD